MVRTNHTVAAQNCTAIVQFYWPNYRSQMAVSNEGFGYHGNKQIVSLAQFLRLVCVFGAVLCLVISVYILLLTSSPDYRVQKMIVKR